MSDSLISNSIIRPELTGKNSFWVTFRLCLRKIQHLRPDKHNLFPHA
jgi:hypothetical protein